MCIIVYVILFKYYKVFIIIIININLFIVGKHIIATTKANLRLIANKVKRN